MTFLRHHVAGFIISSPERWWCLINDEVFLFPHVISFFVERTEQLNGKSTIVKIRERRGKSERKFITQYFPLMFCSGVDWGIYQLFFPFYQAKALKFEGESLAVACASRISWKYFPIWSFPMFRNPNEIRTRIYDYFLLWMFELFSFSRNVISFAVGTFSLPAVHRKTFFSLFEGYQRENYACLSRIYELWRAPKIQKRFN